VDVFGIELKKSACLVLQAFADSGFLTQEQIAAETGLSERSVKYALKELVSRRIISEQQDFCDMRRKSYKIRGGNR